MGAARVTRVAALAAVAVLVGVTGCVVGESPPEPNPPVVVDRMVSTADGRVRRQVGTITVPRPLTGSTSASTSSSSPSAPSPAGVDVVVTIDEEARRQTFDGLGAALTDSSAHLLAGLPADQRTRALRALFHPEDGAGLSVVRLVVGSSDFARSHYSYDDSPTPDPGLSRFTIDHDLAEIIPVAKEILSISPDVQFIASPWSPPAWMKDSGSLIGGSLRPEYEGAFADYLVRFVQAYAAEGIDVRWLTVQNEPQFQPLTYPGMLMGAEQQARLIADDLGPALRKAGLDTEVLVFDHNWDDPGYPLKVMAAPGVGEVAGGVAFHCYKGDQAAAQDEVHAELGYQARIWQTECSGGAWQGTRAEAFRASSDLLLTGLEHWAGASLLWNLALDPQGGPHTGGCDHCRGVVTVDGDAWRANLDVDVTAQVGRWARPGSVRVPAPVSGARAGGARAVALLTPSNRMVVVVQNVGAARTAEVRLGALVVPVRLAADSLTTLRWQS